MGRRRRHDLEAMHGPLGTRDEDRGDLDRRRRRPTDGALGRRARMAAILERDGPSCVWCSRPFGELVQPTTEHVIARVKGGPSWIENEVAACRRCNGERGHASPVQHLDTVRRRGREPRDEVVEAALVRLEERILADGGARRVRGALRSELRKLGRQPRT